MAIRRKALLSLGSIPGWLLVLWKPIRWVLDRLSDYDTVMAHVAQLKPMGAFLLSPWGTVVLMAAGFGWLAWLVTKPPPPSSEPEDKQPSDAEAAKWSWLIEQAQNELRTKSGVVITHYSLDVSHVHDREPFLEILLDVFNGSIWPISVQKNVEGEIMCDGFAMKGPPQLKGGESIGIQSQVRVALRQWLSEPKTVAVFATPRTERIAIEASSLNVRFIKNPDGEHGQPAGKPAKVYMQHVQCFLYPDGTTRP